MFKDDHSVFAAMQKVAYGLPLTGARYNDVLGAGQAYATGTPIGTKPGQSLMTAGRLFLYSSH
jgi:hypothetical protein